jgi:two-component system sensor histidine kinase RegB
MPVAENHTPATTAAINLRRLLTVRAIAIAGLFVTLAFAATRLRLHLPTPSLLATLGAWGLVTLATLWRLLWLWPVRDAELFAQLLVDVAALTVLFYFSGGASNPFVMLYLLPLAFTAAALPGHYVWAMAGTTAVCYGALFLWHQPFMTGGHAHDTEFGLHVFGMWLGYVLSAGLIAGFAARMNATLRARERALAELREQALREERVVALGTFATGAAHELGTPLSTLAVLAKDIEPGVGIAADKLAILRTQIARCKEILGSLSSAAGQLRAEAGERQTLDRFLDTIIQRWQALRPDVTAQIVLDGPRPGPAILAEQTLAQAITNVLNNAADASPAEVAIDACWTHDELVLEIGDRGPGLAPEAANAIGTPFITSKREGLGLGLFLATTTFNRLGGELQLMKREGGGMLCRMSLPLETLRVNTP